MRFTKGKDLCNSPKVSSKASNLMTRHLPTPILDNFVQGLVFTSIFVQLWYQYDTDGSGYIEADELKVDNMRIGCRK